MQFCVHAALGAPDQASTPPFLTPNLAYRMTKEEVRDECAGQIIDRWEDKLSVVDLWADSLCETVVLYAIMH